MPLYRKSHSRGEFVFDFSWANAYAQHGLRYYPKLLSAVPFTPVSGPRLLVDPTVEPEAMRAALIRAVARACARERLSSWHVLFPTDPELARVDAGRSRSRGATASSTGSIAAIDSFDAFLATFTAEKRKKAKRERRRVAEAGIVFDTRSGADMDDALWHTVYEFYADTFYRHGHEPYLNLKFFKLIGARCPSG